MSETEVFGVRDTEGEHVGFVSVMGALGEHLSVAVYQGGQGLAGFCRMHALGASLWAPEDVLDTPQLQASFEDRDLLEKEDRQVVNALGLTFGGHHGWPLFRSYRPGYLPWLLEADEARFLALTLEQVLEVAPRLEAGALDVAADFWGGAPEKLLVRSPRPGAGGIEWSESWEAVALPAPAEIPIEIDELALARLDRLPGQDLVLEVTFDLAPFAVHQRRQRPYVPRLLLAVESQSGFILGTEAVPPQASPEHTLGTAPAHLCRLLAQRQLRPRLVRVRSVPLAAVLRAVLGRLDIQVEEIDELPTAEDALESLARFLR